MIVSRSPLDDNRKGLPSVITVPFITSEKCDEIVESCNNNKWSEGTVFKFGQFIKAKEHRSVLVARNGLDEEVLDNIFKTIFKINNKLFRFHLDGFNEKDAPLVFKYSAEREDHYQYHTDLLIDSFIRKLSFSIQLSDPDDYEGGDLEFNPNVKEPKIRHKGNMTIFPSYMTHRVTPVTRGTRYVIVGWIYGPEFK
jgi:PKHD-type hydroxylase